MISRRLISVAVLTSLLALGFLVAQTAFAAEEQAVIATIKLRSGEMGTAEERDRIYALENQLSAAIKNSSSGEFDGDEYGGGVCTIYMYGPSADRLLSVTLPILKGFHAPLGSFVIKRYGKPGAKQDRIPLGSP